MSLYVKICGLTTADMILAAIEAGADAVGFVFAESPREVSIDQAVLLAGLVRGHADIVCVMHHPDAAYAHEVQARVQPDVLQTDHEDFDVVTLLPGVTSLPVYRDHVAATVPADQRILFEGATSGSGSQADWSRAATAAKTHSLILAGGLAPENVASAIAQVRPYGVDVSSGVESSRGVKDAARISAFIAAARAAHRD
ncbi:MAG: phosphoribosylanthranilate isomerase [Pseudomonadota bacterium]